MHAPHYGIFHIVGAGFTKNIDAIVLIHLNCPAVCLRSIPQESQKSEVKSWHFQKSKFRSQKFEVPSEIVGWVKRQRNPTNT